MSEVLGSLVVYVGGSEAPRDTEWEAYLHNVEETAKRMQHARIAIFAGSGAPTATQRKRAAELSKRYPVRAVVISPSPVARTIVTLLRWLGTDIRAFGPDAAEEALRSIEVTEGERRRALEARDRMLREIEP
jgi:hypothetical protein